MPPYQLHIIGDPLPAKPRCSVCGHSLRNPKSIAAGIGPECRRSRGKRILRALREPVTTRTAKDLEKVMDEAAVEIERLTKLVGKKGK